MPIPLPNGQTVPTAKELQAAGFYGYAGWGDPEAGLNFVSTGGQGKGSQVTNIGPSSTFNFNYENAASQAYDELGSYYDRILKESKGDLNLALSRLVEDYDRGVRNTTQSAQSNALSRGIYQKSTFDPGSGYGLADTQLQKSLEPLTIQKQRRETDLTEEQRRREFDLEQKRREEAAGLANTRGQQAYQRFSAGLV